MELLLPQTFDRQQALRYLGISGDADQNTLALLDKADKALRTAVQPRAAVQFAAKEALSSLLVGSDIKAHLEGCDGCVLLGCSLGAGLDALIRTASVQDMAYSVVLDALASAVIEQLADAAEQRLREQVRAEGRFLTGRFSPGYGDFSIEVQNDLVRLLDGPRQMGLCVTQSHLLTPRKSITAVLGTADHSVTGRRAGCAHCALKATCRYRKEGKTCESSI